MSDDCVYCRSCGASDRPLNGHCYHCGSIEIEDCPDDPFDSYEESIEYDECDMQGHDWIDDYAGETVCQRCGATYYEEEGP